jgi:hypothetical protein
MVSTEVQNGGGRSTVVEYAGFRANSSTSQLHNLFSRPNGSTLQVPCSDVVQSPQPLNLFASFHIQVNGKVPCGSHVYRFAEGEDLFRL